MNKIYVGHLNQFDKQGARKVMAGHLELAVFRLSDGRVAAIENRCPHKNGKLSEGMVCGEVVHCPLHDWRIDVISGEVLDPDHGCVKTFQTEVDASGNVHILLEREGEWADDIRQTG